jgi:TRAP-type mannitol/chloroaromatic compound transport system permease small subunit
MYMNEYNMEWYLCTSIAIMGAAVVAAAQQHIRVDLDIPIGTIQHHTLCLLL